MIVSSADDADNIVPHANVDLRGRTSTPLSIASGPANHRPSDREKMSA